jgi:hypothetical protein
MNRRNLNLGALNLVIPYAVQSGFRYPAFASIQLSLFLRGLRCQPLEANPLQPTFEGGLTLEPALWSSTPGVQGSAAPSSRGDSVAAS